MVADGDGFLAIGAGLAVGLAGLGSGIAEGNIGAAGMGAMAENPEMSGKVLMYVVIPETIVIFGLVMGLLLWLKMGA